jgi:hypothetical protein
MIASSNFFESYTNIILFSDTKCNNKIIENHRLMDVFPEKMVGESMRKPEYMKLQMIRPSGLKRKLG